MSAENEELESLLFDWEDGVLSDSGIERVREILRNSESAREHYVRRQMLTTALRLDLLPDFSELPKGDETCSSKSLSLPSKPLRDSAGLRVSYRIVAVVMAVSLFLCGRVIQLELANKVGGETGSGVALTADRATEPMSQGIALMTRLVDAEWESALSPEVGEALPAGRLRMASGLAQIEFFCGATLVVEGPAELDLLSPVSARLIEGRVRANVPPAARGFTLEVDGMKVVDLGTEFGLSAGPEQTGIQVFDGEVELHQPNEALRVLNTGEAVVRSSDGRITGTEITPSEFVDMITLQSRASGHEVQRLSKWRSWSREHREDDRLIAYYAFSDPEHHGRRLPESRQPGHPELDGAIVGARYVAGRWGGKGGLEFRHPGDRVRVQIPGTFDSLSLVCWVRIDSLDRWYNSLFLTDNYNQGEPHWQILDTGQLFFSVRHKADQASGNAVRGPTHQPILSPSFWYPGLSGRWIHLATTYDAESGEVVHYLNGNLLHRETIAAELRVRETRIGAASIGNWSLPTREDAEFAVRNLNGSLDEFAIYSAVLPPEEIHHLYETGKP